MGQIWVSAPQREEHGGEGGEACPWLPNCFEQRDHSGWLGARAGTGRQTGRKGNQSEASVGT